MSLKSSLATFVVAVLVVCAWTSPAAAQTPAPQTGRLVITVQDQTGAILPSAVVKLAGQEEATRAVTPASASNIGVAAFDALALGRYTLEVSFNGFETAVIRDVRVRAGETKRTVTLRLRKLEDSVTVGRDGQTASLDPRGSAFSTVLTREQIEMLPDDPDEMEAVLKAMAPPGSVIRVDGFTGGRLPPKSQIRSIRLPRMDQFAAQNHGGSMGMMHIDIMTQPGAGPLRGSADFNFFDDALNARNVFTPIKGPEQLRQYGMSLSGTIRPNRTAFSFNAGGVSQYTAPSLLARLPDGTTLTDTVRQPRESLNFNARLDHGITKDHVARFSLMRDESETSNLGVGDYNLVERGYTQESTNTIFRFSENGPIGRRLFTESRLQLRWSDSSARAAVEAPTIRVLDAFTSGGAQMQGGRNDLAFEVATDLDYVRGNHSWRAGALVEGGRYESNDTSNYLGTFTFASMADYLGGRPSSYTRRLGNPELSYSHYQAGVYLQDDWRMLRSLLVSTGVRYGVQSHVGDNWNLSPRMNLAWVPAKNGSLTLRMGYGYFYDWVSGDTYKQTLLVDGVRQRELNIRNPAFPNPGIDGTTPPTNQYVWGEDLVLPSTHRLNAGFDRVITSSLRLNVNYSYGWGLDLLRARNLNAPVNGARPDPTLANVVALVADAESRSHSLNVGLNLSLMNWKRTFLFANYTLAKARTNTAGAFSLPANGDHLDTEWGPSAGDIRHRFTASLNMQPIANMSMSLNVNARSAMPYNITTGRDDNGDGLFNDRPAGVSRNSARQAASFDVGGRVSYAWGFGRGPQQGGPGGGTQVVMIGGGGGGLAPGFGGGAADKRFRIEVYASGQNLLNRANYGGYSGVMTSPFFGRATNAMNPRKIQVGVRFGF